MAVGGYGKAPGVQESDEHNGLLCADVQSPSATMHVFVCVFVYTTYVFMQVCMCVCAYGWYCTCPVTLSQIWATCVIH